MALNVIPNHSAGISTYHFDDAGKFDLPILSGPDSACLPAIMFQGAATRLGDVVDKRRAIKADPNLSELGREARLEPLRAEAVLNVARLDAVLDADEVHWNKREEALLAVPQIAPENSVAAIEAREIRDWFRSLPLDEKARVMDQMDSEPGHEKTILALLRSPIPQLETDVKFVRGIWDRTRRLDNVAEALAIEQGRANLEWARRGTANLAGMTKNMVGWSDDKVVRLLLTAEEEVIRGANKVFGIDPRLVEQTKRVLAHEAHLKK